MGYTSSFNDVGGRTAGRTAKSDRTDPNALEKLFAFDGSEGVEELGGVDAGERKAPRARARSHGDTTTATARTSGSRHASSSRARSTSPRVPRAPEDGDRSGSTSNHVTLIESRGGSGPGSGPGNGAGSGAGDGGSGGARTSRSSRRRGRSRTKAQLAVEKEREMRLNPTAESIKLYAAARPRSSSPRARSGSPRPSASKALEGVRERARARDRERVLLRSGSSSGSKGEGEGGGGVIGARRAGARAGAGSGAGGGAIREGNSEAVTGKAAKSAPGWFTRQRRRLEVNLYYNDYPKYYAITSLFCTPFVGCDNRCRYNHWQTHEKRRGRWRASRCQGRGRNGQHRYRRGHWHKPPGIRRGDEHGSSRLPCGEGELLLLIIRNNNNPPKMDGIMASVLPPASSKLRPFITLAF